MVGVGWDGFWGERNTCIILNTFFSAILNVRNSSNIYRFPFVGQYLPRNLEYIAYHLTSNKVLSNVFSTT